MAISLKFRIALQVLVLFFVATLCVKGQITPPDSTSYLDTLKDEGVTEQVQNKSTLDPSGQRIYQKAIIPPSPNAAALGKFGSMPVSLHTGTPNISIPLYTLRGRELAVPISLDYHASGIKLEEVASNVGLGWSLSAGGQITQTIRGGNDRSNIRFQGLGISCADFPNNAPGQTSVGIDIATHNQIMSGEADAEPDLFTISLPGGRTIRFFFDGNGTNRTLHILEHSNSLVKITPPSDFFVRNTPGNKYWQVTTEDGTKYYFGIYQRGAVLMPSDYHLETTESITQGDFSKIDRANVTWLLARIENANGTDAIDYYYDDYELKYEILVSNEVRTHRTATGGSTNPGSNFYGSTTIHIRGKRIARIESALEEISFINGAERCDVMQPNPGAKSRAVQQVYVERTSHTSQILKHYKLHYNNTCVGVNERLMLQSIEDVTDQPRQLYSFEYYAPPLSNSGQPRPLPSRNEKARDFWGYWNGRSSNTLLPPFDDGFTVLRGADRSPSLDFARVNTLKKVTYPTGGATSFDYELHTYTVQGQVKEAGGLRLRTMTDHDGIDPANDITTYYKYEDDNNITSGIVMSHPRFESISFHDETTCGATTSGGQYATLTRRATTNIPLVTTQGASVGYSQVTELKGLNGKYGKSVYKYQNGMTNPQPPVTIDTRYPQATPPVLHEIPNQENGTLLEKSTYKFNPSSNSFSLVTLEKHDYNSLHIAGKEALGVKVGVETSASCPSCAFYSFFYVPSGLKTSWWFQTHSLLRSYDQDDPTRYTEQETHYFYANHTLNPNPTHVYTKTSQDTRWKVQYSKGVVDYSPVSSGSSDNMVQALRHMQDYNQVNLPVEQVSYYSNTPPPSNPLTNPLSGSGAELRSSVLNLYRIHNDGLGNLRSVLDEVHASELDNTQSPYTPTYMSGSGLNFIIDNANANFTSRVKFTNYNDYGNLLTQKPMPSGQAISYIWGYEKTLPIAEVLNLENPNNAAHFNFEEDPAHVGTTNSPVNGLLPKTGERFLNVSSLVSSGSGELVHDALDSEGEYILAFWHSGAAGSFNVLSGTASHSFNLPATATGEWKLFETVVSLSNGIVRISFPTGSSYFLDDVRLHPVGTMMKTLTHDPLIGQTSETDAAYKIQYYEYDALNRLRLIRDQNRNILKRINYKFYNE